MNEGRVISRTIGGAGCGVELLKFKHVFQKTEIPLLYVFAHRRYVNSRLSLSEFLLRTLSVIEVLICY